MSPQSASVRARALAVAKLDLPLLLVGESGTGKTLLAECVHRASRRRGGPFVPVSCGAINAQLAESEFFGHVRGAFTGASRDREGYFLAAHGGTIFLDDIDALDPAVQAKLLRVLDSGELQRVGMDRRLRSDVRVIAATNRDPQALVRCGRLREDLLFRLGTLVLVVPPLRERPEDIPVLGEMFLREMLASLGAGAEGCPRPEWEVLSHYDWPGNVREVRSHVARWVAAWVGGVSPELLGPGNGGASGTRRHLNGGRSDAGLAVPVPESFVEWDRTRLVQLLERHGGVIARVSESLGVHRHTVHRKLRRYGIDAAQFRRPRGD